MSAVLDHHMADDGIILQRIGRHVLAIAGLLKPAMRHFIDQHEMRVDPGAAITQPGRRGHGATDILGPDRGGEAVIAVIGDGDGVVDNPMTNLVMQGNRVVAGTFNGWEGTMRHVISAYNQENSGLTQGLKFSHTGFDNWQIDVDLSSSTAERKNYWNAIYLDQYAETWSFDTRGTPSITAPAGSPLLTPEKASYNWIGNVNEGSTLEDDLKSAQFDIKRDLEKMNDMGVTTVMTWNGWNFGRSHSVLLSNLAKYGMSLGITFKPDLNGAMRKNLEKLQKAFANQNYFLSVHSWKCVVVYRRNTL